MFNRIASGRGVVLAAITAGATLAGVSASVAGECPAGKFKTDVRAPANHAGKGVTDTVLAAIDLEKEPANIKDRQLRFRKLTIEPVASCPGTATAIAPRSSTLPRARSSNTPATALIRSCTKPATSGRRRAAPRTGGRTTATRPSFCSWAMSFTTRTTTTCDDARASFTQHVTLRSGRHISPGQG